jgi:nucleoside-diphosphate-sugar epimerase
MTKTTGKNVFIIGPGLIGWNVLELLVEEGYNVSGLVRREEDKKIGGISDSRRLERP